MTEILNCLPRRPTEGSAVKCFSQGHNRMVGKLGQEVKLTKELPLLSCTSKIT